MRVPACAEVPAAQPACSRSDSQSTLTADSSVARPPSASLASTRQQRSRLRVCFCASVCCGGCSETQRREACLASACHQSLPLCANTHRLLARRLLRAAGAMLRGMACVRVCFGCGGSRETGSRHARVLPGADSPSYRRWRHRRRRVPASRRLHRLPHLVVCVCALEKGASVSGWWCVRQCVCVATVLCCRNERRAVVECGGGGARCVAHCVCRAHTPAASCVLKGNARSAGARSGESWRTLCEPKQEKVIAFAVVESKRVAWARGERKARRAAAASAVARAAAASTTSQKHKRHVP